ncbi:MAG TPA: EamA family transporter [Ideonella sp.]|nr:EamA family transporter [Ideonella sp.]
MPLLHLLLALAIVVIWGTNFVVIKWGLAELPPFALAALRFALSSLPFLPFIRRPAVPWRTLAAFGLLLGVGQFGLLFLAMRGDISPGLASLVIQVQVFFTVGMAMARGGERVTPLQVLACGLAVAGMAVIASHANDTVAAGVVAVSLRGLALVLVAALCWAAANLVARSAGRIDALGFMVWSSLFAAPPLAAISLLFEGGPAHVGTAVLAASPAAWATVAWQAVGNTLFGYGCWNWLLARHDAATVAPMALGVPVFGMAASAWALGEALPVWKLAAALLVMSGLALNLWAARRKALGRPVGARPA